HRATSTLLPYTPLFRSSPTTPPPEVDTAVPEEPSIDHDGDDGGMSLPGCPSRAAPPPPASQTTSRELTSGVLASGMLGRRWRRRDRKSTRLNSSHVSSA